MTVSSSFPDNTTIATLTAKALLEIGAVKIRPNEPFKLTSGKSSPVYVDIRKVISYPRVRDTLMGFCVSKILSDIGFEQLDGIAGGETAGIPFAAFIADRLGLPMQYVRKQPKGFGAMAQIEGTFKEGDRILLVEDLATDGGSKIRFIDALRHAGAAVKDTIVIFQYGIFPETAQAMQDGDFRLHSLATWWDVLRVAKEQGNFSAEDLKVVEGFLNNPHGWQG